MGINNSKGGKKNGEENFTIDLSSNRIDLRNKNLQKVPEQILSLDLNWLSLSQNKISTIPPEIGKLENLKVLRIFSNSFEVFPKHVSRLSKLTTLDIGKNSIEQVGGDLGNCISLTELNLQSNRIPQLPEEIGNLTNMKALNLYINQLEDLPNTMSQLIGIESLDLAHNRFQSIPKVIGALTNLTTLSLIANGFEEMPEELASLQLLRRLDIRCNYITQIPEIYCDRMNELRILLAKNNRLTSLPKNFGNFAQLTECRVEVNSISEIPESIGDLKTLKSLYIFENRLKEIPESLGDLCNLSELDISNNDLESLPLSLSKLTSLDILYIASNHFKELPKCLSSMSSLTDLAILGNRINNLSEDLLQQFTSIGKLNLNHNLIPNLPNEISSLTNLAILELADNAIEEIPNTISSLTNLNYINLAHNRISTIPISFPQLTKLHKFYISYNNLENYEWTNEFNSLELEEFVGSGNNFKVFPRFLFSLGSTLKYLDLSANNISQVSSDIKNLTILETLILSCNKIEQLPDEFTLLTTLTELDLSHNLLSFLPNDFGNHLTSLTDIDLSGNLIEELTESFCSIAFLQLKLAHNKILQLPKVEAKWISAEANLNSKVFRKRKDTYEPMSVKKRKDTNNSQLSQFKFDAGWAETRGRRPDQQDTITVLPNFRGSDFYAGLFDGHGGSESAEFSASYLHYILKDYISSHSSEFEVPALLKMAFNSTQKEVAKRNIGDGTAANVIFITGDVIYVANAGDARSILCRKGEAFPLSKDHKPDHQQERERIEKAGGFVTESKRVNGVLALSRAIGDCDLQPPVSCEPDVTKTVIKEGDSFIICGCDGLWDVTSNEKACQIVMNQPSPASAAAALRDFAYTAGSTDNISIIVIQIIAKDS